MSVYFRQNHTNCNFKANDSWVVLSPIEQRIKAKIEAVGTPLKDWNINIYRGILTGYNDAFIIDGKRKDELIAADPKSAEIIRPILRGRDIKRYGYDFANIWLINVHNGIKEKGVTPIDINNYPAIKKHLNIYYPEIEKRQDKGITPYNLRNCAYIEDFSNQKIVWGEISDKTKFSIDLEGRYMNEATTFLMVGESLLYLLAYLNSNLSEYYFSKIGTTTGVGTIRWKKFTIGKLLVPKIGETRRIEYEKVVLKILENIAISEDSYKHIDIINKMIYQEFNFTEEEISAIETQ